MEDCTVVALHQNTGLESGLLCTEDCTSLTVVDTKTLTKSQTFGAWKVVNLLDSSLVSKTLALRYFCAWDTVRLSINILTPKSLHLSQAFDAWKTVQLSDSSKTPKLYLSQVVGALKTVQWAIIA